MTLFYANFLPCLKVKDFNQQEKFADYNSFIWLPQNVQLQPSIIVLLGLYCFTKAQTFYEVQL